MKCGARLPRLRIAHGEILLVRAHREADHFAGQIEKRRVHVAEQHHRPLDQPRDFFKQADVLDQLQLLRGAELLGLLEDDASCALRARSALSRRAASRRDRRRLFSSASPPARGSDGPRSSASLPHAFDADLHRACRRTRRECCAAGAPIADRSIAERIDFGHGNARMISGMISCTIAGVARPARSILRDVEGALLVFDDLRLSIDFEPRAFQKALDRLIRRADARAFLLFVHVRGFRRQIVDHGAEAARRRERLDRLRAQAPRAFSFSPSARARSSSARFCMRAGISSEKNSSRSCGISSDHVLPRIGDGVRKRRVLLRASAGGSVPQHHARRVAAIHLPSARDDGPIADLASSIDFDARSADCMSGNTLRLVLRRRRSAARCVSGARS